MPLRISDEKIHEMSRLRENGLSNKQIAIELGISYGTVHHYLGDQVDMLRGEYGAIPSHITGESFEKKPIKRSAIVLTNTVKTYKGRDFEYRVDSSGKIRINFNSGYILDFEKDALMIFASEVNDLIAAIDNERKV